MTRLLAPVVFDLDGVLVDSEPAYEAAFIAYLASIGRGDAEDLFDLTIGRRPEEFAPELADRLGRRVSDVEAGIRAASIASIDIQRVEPMPYANLVVARLATQNWPMAIASSSSRRFIECVLTARGLAGRFSVVVSGDDVRRGKPDPEIFRLTAERLGVDAATCIVVEDSPVGIEAAAAAGMLTIAVPNRYTKGSEFQRANAVVPDLLCAYTLIAEGRIVR